ncbi:polysaccharide biosynthesis/export family protein [Sphingosinicella rhizophila]|uniref:Polysaccharide biosynthesis/export family protein n=1 Tax=Sphingosinicella rhizophila TaxID=3050082 RepID=A0ABU3Q8S8_9SPHN|nr:polysaccharide biosynthesis/export family protein [Sphingosinicella sp. GR2756]MDT9599702.1 polysaccharide biosynthesis/export family protein [Sphingosinicella sp. GR2756]
MPTIIDTRQTASSFAPSATVTGSLRLGFLLVLLAAFAALAGCTGTRGGPVPYEVQNFSAPDTPQPVTLEEDYKISPLDTLTIKVFQVPDLSGDFPVDLRGRISMPLLGEVKAVDLTASELDKALTQQLGVKYLQSPDVSVGIKSSTRRNVTIDGAVRSPGMFPIPGPMTLLQVIAMANGTTEDANARRIAVFRTIDGKRMAAAFDLTDIRRAEAEDPKIYPGDVVVVDGSNIKRAQREILQTIPIVGFFYSFVF